MGSPRGTHNDHDDGLTVEQEARKRALVWAEIVDTTEKIHEGGSPSRLAMLHQHRAGQWRRFAGLAPEAGYATAASIAAQQDDDQVATLRAVASHPQSTPAPNSQDSRRNP